MLKRPAFAQQQIYVLQFKKDYRVVQARARAIRLVRHSYEWMMFAVRIFEDDCFRGYHQPHTAEGHTTDIFFNTLSVMVSPIVFQT